jgi:hypothetical protein
MKNMGIFWFLIVVLVFLRNGCRFQDLCCGFQFIPITLLAEMNKATVQFSPPETAGCHSKQYEEWSGSSMRSLWWTRSIREN